MIYFTMKNLNENRAFLGMLGFLLISGCSKDNGNGNGEGTKYTLTVTKPTNGTLSSDAGGIDCGSKGTTCKAEFSKGAEVTLTAKGFSSGPTDLGHTPAAWQGACDKTAADQPCKLSMDANKAAGKLFTDIDIDDDNDGLIEVHNLDMFNHIRYNLAGTSYKTGADAEDNRKGAPTKITDDCTAATDSIYLCGYELARDLDFAEGASYAGGTVNADWRPDDSDTSVATNEGFSGPSNFAGIFEGNGYNISNLYSRGGGNRGLFRATTSDASIRNLGVVDANLYVSDSSASSRAGGLVGQNQGSIVSSYAKGGNLNGGAGDDNVGGLVGQNQGSIVSSYAKGGNLNGGVGADHVGGLVGHNNNGTITASHAMGNVNGGTENDKVGGLVGYNEDNTTTIASYATGAVDGGDGDDYVGGLVGGVYRTTNSITASHATGAVNGGAGADSVGGLVGDVEATTTITVSHATGVVNGGAGVDHVGGLVGSIYDTSILASYAAGDANGGAENDNVGGLVGYMFIGTNTITVCYARGAANGGAGDDRVGGLAGYVHESTNTITASYATGEPDGGDAAGTDTVGALAGEVTADSAGTTNTITHSYAFGATADVDTAGNDGDAHPAGLTGSGAAKANTLTAPGGGANTDANSVWDQAASKTKDAWDFGTTSQAPALKYADYDGPGASSVDYCALFPDKIPGTDTTLVCGTSLLPDQPGR